MTEFLFDAALRQLTTAAALTAPALAAIAVDWALRRRRAARAD